MRGETITGQGNSEGVWRNASALIELPEISAEALLGEAERLVVVAPHPDDEILGCGGLIASVCMRGLPVQLIALTDGEAAYPDDAYWRPPKLAEVRRMELRAAAQALGVSSQVSHLGFPDGQLAAHCDQVASALLAQFRPNDIVLVTWRNDGHPDHEAAADAVALASKKVAARQIEYPVWAWHWADPANAQFLKAGSVRLPLCEASLEAKRRAIKCFKTQIGDCDPAPLGPVLPPHVLARFEREFEVYCQ